MTLVAGSSPCAPHSDCSHSLAPLTGQQCFPTHHPLPVGSNHDQQEVISIKCMWQLIRAKLFNSFILVTQVYVCTHVCVWCVCVCVCVWCVCVCVCFHESPHCPVVPAQREQPLPVQQLSSQPATCCPSEPEEWEST